MCFFIHLSLFTLLTFSITEATNHLQYLNHSCSSKKTFPPNSAYQSNLHALLTSLSSHASTTQFYNTTASGGNATESETETVYGSFTCRGDVTKDTCQECVTVATGKIAPSRCAFTKEAIVWYHECTVRYSNRRFFSSVDEWPRFTFMNYSATTNSTKEGSYGWLLANTLSDAVAEAANAGPAGTKKFATKNASLSASERVYTLVQCTPDLSSQDCNRCLDDIMKDIPLCCLGKDCGMVLFPSCSLMFGIDQFYRDVPVVLHRESPPTSVGKPPGEQKARSLKFLIVVVPVILLLMLFHGHRIRRINMLRRYKAILKENFGNETTTLESLRFDLATIEVATNKFSNENLIGRGGFGEVYKGILHDGRKIAVKRLSTCSRQGAIEFKNEVLLIAKLQHKNLVTLFGFCLQEKEKILVYEFVPNKSLDYFLFDPHTQRMLSWCERYRIIAGIAGAILYLHEYSRVKIIHRDIKPSNILLDEDMNPKISDFGIAKIIATNQDQERTKRIVGTYGYMSPEYAMLGRFSEKSDIFSFGVMILEIVTGKKNSISYESYCNDGLLSYAWKQWRDGTPLEILDPNLCESCSEVEVIKCIHLGLLCVQQSPENRPDMTMVVSCLSNISVELPFPREPAFFNIHSRTEANTMALQLSSGHDGTPYSINEMSISNSLPR